MKGRSFYVLSAAAMLAGCHLLSRALQLEAGQLTGLLVLLAVLQAYECLLVGLGTRLLARDPSASDGVALLALETLFLLDATLLATECVTAHLGAGTAVAALTLLQAVAKIGLVRRRAPAALAEGPGRVLGLHVAFVLAVPVGAALLARARLLGPATFYGFWWAGAALPVLRLRLAARDASEADDPGPVRAIWTWLPAAGVLL